MKNNKSTLIFETPTRKGWLTIYKVDTEYFANGHFVGLDTKYLVQLDRDKELKDKLVHLYEHLDENSARQFAQGLYIGIECL